MVALSQMVAEFQGQIEAWEEYGISDLDCAKALRVCLASAKIEFDDDCIFLHGSLSTQEQFDAWRPACAPLPGYEPVCPHGTTIRECRRCAKHCVKG